LGKRFNSIKEWSSENRDLVNLVRAITGVLAIIFTIAGVLFTFFKSTIKSSKINFIGGFITHNIVIPFYLLFLLLSALLYGYIFLKRRSAYQLAMKNTLIGDWENRWDGPQPGREFFSITNDFKYLLNGAHYFDIKKFRFNKKNNQIRFSKVGVKEKDKRILLNVLLYGDGKELKGDEIADTGEKYGITYVKINTVNTSPDNPSLSVKAFSSFSEAKDITHPLKIHFHIAGKQHRSIVINSVTFFGNNFIEIERKSKRFLEPNSYSCNMSVIGEEKYSEEIIINLKVKAESWVPINPLIGKFTLDRALMQKVTGVLHFNYSFVEDKSKTYPYTCLF
jgi:hypothetical protein